MKYLIWVFTALVLCAMPAVAEKLELGLSARDFVAGEVPRAWHLRRWSPSTFGARAYWVQDDGVAAVRLVSRGNLVFLEKAVDIDIRRLPWVSWRWKVENILEGVDETREDGDDHPLRIFFAFAPDEKRQTPWLRLKRWLYLDRKHGHPFGGRYTEYLWSSQFPAGSIIADPGMPMQKLMVIEGGAQRLGQWLGYRRNLYQDFKHLYGEEPRRLIYLGILNDTDQTGQAAVSYIADLVFSD